MVGDSVEGAVFELWIVDIVGYHRGRRRVGGNSRGFMRGNMDDKEDKASIYYTKPYNMQSRR